MPTSTCKNCGEESNLMLSDLSSESDAGSIDNFQLSTESKDHQDSTKLEPSDSSKSKDTLSTELESEEEEEREQSTRVSFTVSQSIWVSESKRRPDPTEMSLKKRSVENAQTSEFSTHTG